MMTQRSRNRRKKKESIVALRETLSNVGDRKSPAEAQKQQSVLFLFLPSIFVDSIATGKSTTNGDYFGEHQQHRRRFDPTSGPAVEIIESNRGRPQRLARPSVDAISDDELFAIKRCYMRRRSDEQLRELGYVALAGGAREIRVLDRLGGCGSYGVALKPTYRLFFLCWNPPVCGSVL